MPSLNGKEWKKVIRKNKLLVTGQMLSNQLLENTLLLVQSVKKKRKE